VTQIAIVVFIAVAAFVVEGVADADIGSDVFELLGVELL
jgi:hypothetical protein